MQPFVKPFSHPDRKSDEYLIQYHKLIEYNRAYTSACWLVYGCYLMDWVDTTQDIELAIMPLQLWGLHNSIRTWLLVIYAVDHGSLYINHQKLTYRFHLFMLAIIYNAIVWPCVINILNSNYISSTRHSVLLEQHAFVSKMLISRVGMRQRRGWKSLNGEERWSKRECD